MFIEITKDTNVKRLIELGAASDGKVTQQILLANKGLNIPRTFFFTSGIIKKENNNFIVEKDVIEKIISHNKEFDSEFQVRTETVNEINRSKDYFSESRIGLKRYDLEENIVSVCTHKKGVKNIVGLIQELPPKSLERNTLAGLGQIANKSGKKFLYVDLLHGLATYLGRAGSYDATLEYPIEGTKENIKSLVKYKTKKEILNNFSLSIMRHGIKLTKKDYSLIKLPWSKKNNRLKKEYEYSNEELSQKSSEIVDEKTFLKLFESVNKVESYKRLIDFYEIKSSYSESTLKDLILIMGMHYLIKVSDEHNTTKIFIEDILDLDVEDFVSEETLRLVVDNLLKIGEDVLSNHLASFSVTVDETSDFKEKIIIWDLPLDKEINLNDEKAKKDVFWIKKSSDLENSDLEHAEEIGMDLQVSENFNEDLQFVLNKLNNFPNIKTVHIKYSLLSHPATIIREKGYKVLPSY